jgi:hypothetical protein
MITKFQIFENSKGIDPYGEEEWEDDYKVGDFLICQIDYSASSGSHLTHAFKKGKSYEIVDVKGDEICIMSDTGKSKWEKKGSSEFKKTPPLPKRAYVPVNYIN